MKCVGRANVTHKAKALESQKHTIDHAVVEANRLNELVWSMDSQIAKLNEGNKQIARTEDNLARMEKLAFETTSQLDAATKAKDELAREIARVEKDGHALNDSIRGHVDKLTVEKKEFEIFDQRLRVSRQRGRSRRAHGIDRGEGQERSSQSARRHARETGIRAITRPMSEQEKERRVAHRTRSRWTSWQNAPNSSSWRSIRAAAISKAQKGNHDFHSSTPKRRS